MLTIQANCKMNNDVVSDVSVDNVGEKKSTSQTSRYDFFPSRKEPRHKSFIASILSDGEVIPILFLVFLF